MHQIHAESQLGKSVNPSWSLLDASEHQKSTKRGKQHIGGAELPRPFHHRRFHLHTRHSLPPETPGSKQTAYDEADNPNGHLLPTTPFQVYTNEVCQYEIAQVARAVPQGRELIPKAFTPEFGRHEAVEPRGERREGKETEEYQFVLCTCLFEPRRHHGYDEVDTDERVHEPQMTAP